MAGCSDMVWVDLGDIQQLHSLLRGLMLQVGGPQFAKRELNAAEGELAQVSESDLKLLHATCAEGNASAPDCASRQTGGDPGRAITEGSGHEEEAQKKKSKRGKTSGVPVRSINIVGLTQTQKIRLGHKLE
eukprot:s1557_g14.t1